MFGRIMSARAAYVSTPTATQKKPLMTHYVLIKYVNHHMRALYTNVYSRSACLYQEAEADVIRGGLVN